jgi:hypothetical protein
MFSVFPTYTTFPPLDLKQITLGEEKTYERHFNTLDYSVWPLLTGSLGPQCVGQILAAAQLVECHNANGVICCHGKSCDCEAGNVATYHIHVPVTFPK